MTVIISVIGFKGGVGKTTVANYIANKLKEKGYTVSLNDHGVADFIIYDLDLKYSSIPNFDKALKIFVCDLPSLQKTYELSLFIKGTKILVINKVSPVPKDVIKYIKLIDNLKQDFDEIYLVPFNGGLFNGKEIDEPVLDLLVERIIQGSNLAKNKKVIYPFL